MTEQVQAVIISTMNFFGGQHELQPVAHLDEQRVCLVVGPAQLHHVLGQLVPVAQPQRQPQRVVQLVGRVEGCMVRGVGGGLSRLHQRSLHGTRVAEQLGRVQRAAEAVAGLEEWEIRTEISKK